MYLRKSIKISEENQKLSQYFYQESLILDSLLLIRGSVLKIGRCFIHSQKLRKVMVKRSYKKLLDVYWNKHSKKKLRVELDDINSFKMRLFFILFLFVQVIFANSIKDEQLFSKIVVDIKNKKFNKAYESFKNSDIKIDSSKVVKIADLSLELGNYKFTKSVLTLTSLYKREEDVLIYSIINHYFKVAEFMLKNFKMDINPIVDQNTQRTLLHFSVLNDDEEAVIFLLKNGAKIDVKDRYFLTPLFYINSKKVLKCFKKVNPKKLRLAKCSILLDEERVEEAITYCRDKARLSEIYGYTVGASWYYLLAKEPQKSKKFSEKLYKEKNYIGNINLAHYYILNNEYQKAKNLYEDFIDSYSDIKEAKRVLIEDFTILRKIYKKRFDIYKAFDIYHEILGDKI